MKKKKKREGETDVFLLARNRPNEINKVIKKKEEPKW